MKRNFTEKQIQILKVAETLFAEKGFDGTSIRDISRGAKINIAMISYYFGSKERLLESLLLYSTSDLKSQLDQLIHEELAPLDKINKLIALYINRINTNKGIYRILHFEFSSEKRAKSLASFSELKKRNLKKKQNDLLSK